MLHFVNSKRRKAAYNRFFVQALKLNFRIFYLSLARKKNILLFLVLPKRNLDKNNKANKVYNTQWGAHLMAERKRYSAEEKSAIVLEILQDGKKVSDVAEEHGIHPNQIMLWKKQALENMAELFKTERKDITAKKEQREISELKSQIAHKDSVIAELADENMSLKKKSFGLRLTK